jgi:hypothetical protein
VKRLKDVGDIDVPMTAEIFEQEIANLVEKMAAFEEEAWKLVRAHFFR